MSLKNKKKNSIVIILIAVALLIALVAGLLAWSKLSTLTTADARPTFVFNKAQAPGWWGGVNNWPEESDFEGGHQGSEELPVASMVIYQGTEAQPGDCFVMSSYKNGTVDIDTKLKERRDAMLRDDGDGPSLEFISSTQQTIQTPEGTKDYAFYQYDFTLPGQEVQKGYAFGFVNLANGYIEIRGVCSTVDKFPSVQPGLAAIRLDP